MTVDNQREAGSHKGRRKSCQEDADGAKIVLANRTKPAEAIATALRYASRSRQKWTS